MNGANPIGIHINTPFTDPGATAIETCGSPVTLSTNGTVDTSQRGHLYANLHRHFDCG